MVLERGLFVHSRRHGMASAAEETDSAILLCEDAIRLLEEKKPESTLLKWKNTFAGFDGFPSDFLERFGGEHVPRWARGTEFAAAAVMFNYYNALSAELK